MSTEENLNIYRVSLRASKEDQLIEKEMQLKYNQQIEEKILNNILKINILVSIICIFLIIIYFTLDKKIIKLEKKNVIEAEKSKKNFLKFFFKNL
jgi:hypothetical protein